MRVAFGNGPHKTVSVRSGAVAAQREENTRRNQQHLELHSAEWVRFGRNVAPLPPMDKVDSAKHYNGDADAGKTREKVTNRVGDRALRRDLILRRSRHALPRAIQRRKPHELGASRDVRDLVETVINDIACKREADQPVSDCNRGQAETAFAVRRISGHRTLHQFLD